jgi:hypothetical protein
MPNKLQCEQPKENKMEQDQGDTLDNLISKQVIHALGTPADLRKVQVRKVSDNQYRVNVIVGANAGAVRVANSYFLVVDSEGALVTATPRITKQY